MLYNPHMRAFSLGVFLFTPLSLLPLKYCALRTRPSIYCEVGGVLQQHDLTSIVCAQGERI